MTSDKKQTDAKMVAASGDYQQLTAALRPLSAAEILRSLEYYISTTAEEDYDQKLVDCHLQVLQEKDPVPEFDVEAQWQRFNQLLDDNQPSQNNIPNDNIQPAKPKPKRRLAMRLVTAAIIVIALVLGSALVAEAFGVDLFQAIFGGDSISLSDREIDSGLLVMEPKGEDNYTSIADALAKHNISDAFYPTWIPPSFELDDIIVFDDAEHLFLEATFISYSDKAFWFSIDYYYQDYEWTHHTEIDPNITTPYFYQGVEHYLTTNVDIPKAEWRNGAAVYALSGDISASEIKQIINSVYER